MPITIVCPDCAARIRAPDSVEGRPVRCPKCAAQFKAAASSEPEPPAPLEVEPPSSTGLRAPALPRPQPDDEEEWADPVVEEAPAQEEAAAPADASANVLVDVLLFRKLIGPALIQVLFWSGFLGCVVVGGLQFAGVLYLLNRGAGFGAVVGSLASTLAVWFLGPLLVRVACEVLVLLFRIHDRLTEIRDAGRRREMKPGERGTSVPR